jgi:hypothetical protein
MEILYCFSPSGFSIKISGAEVVNPREATAWEKP